MKCQYCGRDNPDGSTYCECGRPLSLGGQSSSSGGYTSSTNSPFSYQTLDSVKRTRHIPVVPIIVLLCALIGVGVFFGLRWLDQKHMTDESSWKLISEPLSSITVPSALDKGEMLTIQGSDLEHLCFYTSRLAGFDVSMHKYTDPEKEMYSGLDAKSFASIQTLRTVKINGQEVKYKERSGKNYLYGEFSRHCPNYVGKSDEVWFIESMFPTPDGCFFVNVYCAEEDKDQYRESMLKWLDSFTSKL